MLQHTQNTTLIDQTNFDDERDPNESDTKRYRKEDPFSSFHTPTKEPQRIASSSAEHSKLLTQKLANATCDAALEKKRDGATAYDIYLRVHFQAKATSCVVQTTPEESPNQVKEKIGRQINMAAEFLKLYGPAETTKPKCNWPLRSANWHGGSTITCHILEKPTSFDRVGECDQCGDLRHVFYSYARQGPGVEPEPVIELCADCNNPTPRRNKSPRAAD